MIQVKMLQEAQNAREAADRQWREDQAERERVWREAQAKREHDWRNDDLIRDRDWRKEDRSLAMSNLFVAAGVGIISALVALIAAKLLPWPS